MEIHENELVALHLSGLTLIENVLSQVQNIQIYQHSILGKVLVINGEIQNVEQWAPLYHEPLIHVPMMFICKPQSVLILGGGDLYAAEIALQYPTVERVVLCDYDPEVIRLTKRYYSHAEAVLDDPRLHVVFQDARKYLVSTQEQFDLIVDDCFNLVEDFLPEDDIFQKLNDRLTPHIGVCTSLIYRHIFDKETMQRTSGSLFKKFKTVMSLVTVPEYPGTLHLLTMWGTSAYLSQRLQRSKNCWHINMIRNGGACGRIFDARFCNYYLYLPQYVKDRLM